MCNFRLDFCNLYSQEIQILQKILQKHHTITEISINGNPNQYQNYNLLLQQTNLTSLSLRFCKINKIGAAKFAEELKIPYGHTLTHLNLSSNFLGDEGVKYIADFLRINRSLLYLNLADNFITDKGCMTLMEVLQKFPLTHEEIVVRRARLFDFYRRKNEMVSTKNYLKYLC